MLSPVKKTSLSRKHWEELKLFVTRNLSLIQEPGTTIEFLVAAARSQMLKANTHTIREVLNIRKIELANSGD